MHALFLRPHPAGLAGLLLSTALCMPRAQAGAAPASVGVSAAPAPASAAVGDAPPADIGGEPAPPELKFESGTVKIGAVATADLPPTFQFLGPKDAQTVVEKVWGNPPDTSVLGLVVPVVNGEPSAEWGVVFTYNEDGHVDDDDAGDINYDEMLQGLKDDMPAINEERKKLGLGTFQLLGWATTPHYDPATHRIHWAKRLKPDDFPENTINYDMRVLGRAGFLEVSAVGAERDLAAISAGMESLLGTVNFVDGQRYDQFDSGMDKAAAYGVGALVAGKVAMKIGFFAGFLKILFVAKKFLILGAIAVGAAVKKFAGRKNESTG